MPIKINNKNYDFKEGETVLDVCQKNGIKIPTLCAFDGLPKDAVCRVCLVEIAGCKKLAPSCATKVQEGMEILTESENAQKARRINLELLWADHAGKCATCKKNRMCELQNLAREYKIENFHFVPRKEEITAREELDLLKDNWARVVEEDQNPCISRNSEFCIECKRCVNICPEKKFGFNYRGNSVVVGTPYEKELDCSFCGKCVAVCPTAALTDQNDHKKILEILGDLKKMAVGIIVRNQGPMNNDQEKISSLGFEKIFEVKSYQEAEGIAREMKMDFAKKEIMNPEDIITFIISNDISKKKYKSEFVDYVFTEREIARLVRDKKVKK